MSNEWGYRSWISKGQLISECLLGVIDFPKKQPKKQPKKFPLESKKWSNQQSIALFYNDKNLHMIIWPTYLTYYSAFILWFDHFLHSGTEICQIFCCFFGHSKINWPLSQYEYFCKDLMKADAPSEITSTSLLALSWMFAKNNTNYYSLNVRCLQGYSMLHSI